MARDLRQAVSKLEPMTGAALGILALASGIYTYIGVKGLLDGTGGLAAFAAFAYSGAVSVGIYVFWTYILRFLPLMRSPATRSKMILAMTIGSLAIIAMSSWLNAAALAGSAAVEQHLANTVEKYQAAIEQAQENAYAAEGLLLDIRVAESRFSELADEEAKTGALTGTSGAGSVVQALKQASTELKQLEMQIVASREEVTNLTEQAGDHLRRMRELVADQGPVDLRSIEFSEQAGRVAGLIALLKQSSVAPAVKRTTENLGRTFVAPVADGSNADLRQTQTAVVAEVQENVQEQSKSLSAAAEQVLDQPEVLAPRFTPISTAEAVLLYWDSFIPSWAGAISIDLLPAVIVFILWIVQSAIRIHEDPLPIESTMTLQDMEAALDALKRMQRKAGEHKDGVEGSPGDD